MKHQQQKTLSLILLIITIALFPYGCSKDANGKVESITSINQLKGKEVGVATGTMLDQILEKNIPGAIPVYFNTYQDQVTAIKAGKLDAMIMDTPMAILLETANKGDVKILEEKLQNDTYAFALNKETTLPADRIDAIIQELKQDGTLDQLGKKWLEGTKEQKVLSESGGDGSEGVLIFGITSLSEPFSYLNEDGRFIGYDIELAMLIAERLEMKLEIVDIDMGALIASLKAGKVDMIGGCITVSEERALQVRFTESYLDGGISAVVADTGDSGAATGGFIETLKDSFTRTFVTENRYQLILKGLGVTLLISTASAVLGTAMGFLICFIRSSRFHLARLGAKVFIRILQGMPIVLFLMILYYLVFASISIDPLLVAVIGFSLNFAAYVSEMIRSGIEAVDKGQLEAASAMGFGKARTFLKITLPQAARFFLPVYQGEFINMIKMTSVVGYIAIQDLTKMSDIIRSRTYEAFFPLIVTALLYFLIAYAFILLLTWIEKSIDPKQRRRELKGVVLK